MLSLSLSPRYDLFKFALPKTFLPKEVSDKYQKILNQNAGVLATPIDYLNESIKGVNIPGISDLIIEQTQHSSNSIKGLGKLNVEPARSNSYKSTANPLDKINKEITVTFRFNQGFYNYFMLYETIFYKYCKPIDYPDEDVLYIELLDETGRITSRIKFFDCVLDGIEGLEFDYSKIERDTGTFNITFKFNNIDFVFVDENGNEI
jgi:hypothetical protein